jgi:high-affinity iron transporter
MASQAARLLIQANLLPSLASPLWDTSTWLPPDSIPGTLLQGLAGYDARPAGMQILFFAVALVSIFVGMKLSGHSQRASDQQSPRLNNRPS